MSSLVLELQQEAMKKDADLTSLLRKCVVIASKLKLKDFLEWTNSELRGYQSGQEVPKYRQVTAETKIFNPYNGIWMPLMFEDGSPPHTLKRALSQGVAELQDLVRERKGHLVMALPDEITKALMAGSNFPRPPTSIVSQNSVIGILDAVRNSILDWSLKLEADGILGEGMTFTEEERQTAMSHTYNIENFNGILGNVTATSVEIKNYNDIHKALKEKGVPQNERNDLEEIMDEIQKSKGKTKKALVERGLSWVVRNAQNLGALSNTIHSWFNNHNQ